MAFRTPESSDFGDILDKLSALSGNVDTGLNQVKESVKGDLNKLRKENNLGNLATNIFASAESGFKKDLNEIGIRGEAQAELLAQFKSHWEQMNYPSRSREILASPELAAMDGFISQMENLPKLKQLIESAEPVSGWEAMLKGFASRIPGLDKLVDQYFGPVLSSLGLGFLVGKKKAAETQETDTAGTQQAAAETTEPVQAPAETQESQEAAEKPGSTLILGDSINTQFTSQQLREQLGVEGKISVLAKGSQQSGWLLNQLRKKPDSYFEGFQNAVVLIGTNDLGSNDSAEKIWSRMEAIYTILKERNIKIHACTLPPGKGNRSGLWGSDFATVEAKRQDINARIKNSPLIGNVIDLAATRTAGGLADNNDPASLAQDVRLQFERGGTDPIHPQGHILAEIYQRELRERTS